MTVFNPGDRIIYTGNMTAGRIGKTGTVTSPIDTSGHCVVEWDDGAKPFASCLARNLEHYFEQLDLLGDNDDDCI